MPFYFLLCSKYFETSLEDKIYLVILRVDNNISYDGDFKFKPDYKWPEKGSVELCPKCSEKLELVENRKTYFGKPWWCVPCQWQFSEEDLRKAREDSLEEE